MRTPIHVGASLRRLLLLSSPLKYLLSRRSRGNETQISSERKTHLETPHVVSYIFQQAVRGGSGIAIRQRAFTLLEMIAVLAIVAVLAALLLPRLIKRIDLETHAQEKASLASIHDALKLEVVRNFTVPDESNWAQAATRWSSLPSSKVTVNSRRFNRIYYRQTSPNPAIPYVQTTNEIGSPANLRAMVVSTLGGGNGPSPAGGVLSDADFNALWNTPDGERPTTGNWAAWAGTGDDFLIQRIDYAPLFHRLLLVNRDDDDSAWFTINDSSLIRLDRATPNDGWAANYLEGTVVGLCDTGGNLMARHILSRNISFVFERGLWREQITGAFTGVSEADEFAEEAADFLSAQWNTSAHQGADQQGVLAAMYSFMYVFTLWADQSPHFPKHGAAANQVPEFLLLRDVGDDNARLDEFSFNLLR
jgi:prepilin-type N-terminal cleavage/methylation domain-containing protein